MCQKVLDTLRLKPWTAAGEAEVAPVAVGSDQLGDLTLIEAVVQAPRTLRTQFRGTHTGLVRATV